MGPHYVAPLVACVPGMRKGTSYNNSYYGYRMDIVNVKIYIKNLHQSDYYLQAQLFSV